MSKWIGCPVIACKNDLCDVGCVRLNPKRAPLDIIAENLPTFADLYVSPLEVRLPTGSRLAKDAQRIMAALAAEGFEVVRKETTLTQQLRREE